MADPSGDSGIRAESSRPMALLKGDNYRAWSTKMKAQLKVVKCWALVNGNEPLPPGTGPPGCLATVTAAALALQRKWDERQDRAAALLITSIHDDELHEVMDVEDDPEMIWNRLKEKFERVSEAEAENANSQFLEFAHIESETALQTIARFNFIVLKCHDQGIVLTEQSKRRMFIMRPSKRYFFLKQNFLLAPVAAQPTLETLKAQL